MTSARDVLDRLQQGARFDAILCDLMMPDMTGMELFEAIGKLDDAQAKRMIFMTGGAFTPRARAFLDASKNPRLDKPFPPEVLFALLGSVIDDVPPR
jgi:CheY-like chemotaxis protein